MNEVGNSTPFFSEVSNPVRPAGSSKEEQGDLGYRVYDPDRIVAGKRMEDHLRIAVCYWHSFCWSGSDVFGAGTFDRPWLEESAGPLDAACLKQDAAFEFFTKLGTPFFCFHDLDMAPAGQSLRESRSNLSFMVDRAAALMAQSGVQLLWGTANLFSHPRYAAGAATNPDPEVFAYAAAQVRDALEATHRLNGQNYVLWGGREGYETLLNTKLRQEADQLARFMTLVAEHKRSLGFSGALLIEPKPQEPSKHQYDYDCAAVHGFLERYDLMGEYQVNIEANHATLGGHSFHHEVAYALENGIFGSVDANRGDAQNGWDTDQFPNSVEELSLVMYEILQAGGFNSGGFNFDTKLRRQSMDRSDLFHGHIGGIDTLAQALLVADDLIQDGCIEKNRNSRYANWSNGLGKSLMSAEANLATIADQATSADLDPIAVSGRQEFLENEVNRVLWSKQ
ncbi:MAG: xylose isomerase [Microthrixaceae bacterium]